MGTYLSSSFVNIVSLDESSAWASFPSQENGDEVGLDET